MALIPANFGPIGGQSRRGSGVEANPGAPQMWSYRSADTHLDVDTAGYFNQVRQMLEVGDLIYVVVVDANGALSTAGTHVVQTKTATTVDVTNVTVHVMTDTD